MKRDPEQSSGKFRFRRNSTIGAADAADDETFLAQSFLDTGDLAIALDVSNPKAIVVGRTGAGKTALLREVKKREPRVIEIDPEQLSLSFLSNSGVLRFFANEGVNLDMFYRLLWRHVVAVEIVKERYDIDSEVGTKSFFRAILDGIGKSSRAKKRAIEYLRSWGERFWLETDSRIVEMTHTLERQLTDELRATAGLEVTELIKVGGGATLGSKVKLTDEQRTEIQHRGQRVVNDLQIAELNRVIELLNENVLDDAQKPIYITIDRLDENWVDDSVRYHLIRALLESVAFFNRKVRNLKVLIAVREDLLYRTFRDSSAGTQEEKYRSTYLVLSWTHSDLKKMLEARVDHLVSRQYTNQRVSVYNLLPDRLGKGRERSRTKVDPVEYMIDRTMRRPRDLIMFFNECIREAADQPQISLANFQRAEEGYSVNRLAALDDEWRSVYPNLRGLCECLRSMPSAFVLEDAQEDLSHQLLLLLSNPSTKKSALVAAMGEAFNQSNDSEVLALFFEALYKTGVIGLKYSSGTTLWSWRGNPYRRPVEGTRAFVHPAFWSVLSIGLQRS